MAIRIVCPSCREVHNVADSRSGPVFACRQCGWPITVLSDRDGKQARRDEPRRRSWGRSREDDDDYERPRKSNDGGSSVLLLVLLIGGGLGALLLVGLCLLAMFIPMSVRQEAQRLEAQAAADQAQAQAAAQQAGPPLGPPLPVGPPPAKMDPATVTRVKDSTVYIRVELPNGGVAEGSGFLCLEPGLVMTNAHVLGMLRSDATPPSRVDVVVHSGEANELRMVGIVLGVDRTNDLAVLRVNNAAPLPPPLAVDSANRLIETQKVYIFGFPLGAQLGKNITVSESSVSSLRRDGAGGLSQIQVNGGMHPGNSGGPVTDANGVVVGVSVAIIRGTQINFAIPGDFVKQLFDGQFATSEIGTPYLVNNTATLPVKVTCLDPLGRVQNMKVTLWTGNPGKARPAAWQNWQNPPAQAGDGQHQEFLLAGRNGTYTADIPLPPLPPGQVYWVQPKMVNAAGANRWDTAFPIAWDGQIIVERKPALLQFKPPAEAIERSLKMNSTVTLNFYRGNEAATALKDRMEGDVLESLNPDARGLGTAIRLTFGQCPFSRESKGKITVPPPQAAGWLVQYSPTFLVDAANAAKERGNRNFNLVPANLRDTVEGQYETLCNTFEATTLPLPNRVVQPLASWKTQVPMLVLLDGKRKVQDLHLTCTYEGVRSVAGQTEGYVSLVGLAKGRGDRANVVLGKVRGHALVDIDKGFLTQVKVTTDSEIEVEDKGVRVLVSDESLVSRSEGNSLGIVAAKTNQPGAR
jgi:S1-C subfamily serine protease